MVAWLLFSIYCMAVVTDMSVIGTTPFCLSTGMAISNLHCSMFSVAAFIH